jgi:lipoprotein-anchoring transpeptidase ErfK/SrfK
MSNLRVLVLCAVFAGAFVSAASAQDCDRYASACRGSGTPQYQPGAPGGYAPAYPGYQARPAYPGYPAYQAYPGYQGYQQPYGAPGPYAAPAPYEPGYAPRPSAYPPPEEEPAAPARPSVAAPPSEANPAYTYDPALARRFASLYGAVGGEPFAVPAVRSSYVDPAFIRMTVSYQTSEAPGTVIIDPQNHYLYLVQGNGLAIRYGVGVGRQGFGWSGTASIHDKQTWPDWYPPKEMLARQPDLMRQMSELQGGLGMAGGPRNPLGARALYLWQGNKDTLYRIHGTFEPWTIGKSVSSGCIRMINQDVIDLYERVPAGAKVVVLGSGVG